MHELNSFIYNLERTRGTFLKHPQYIWALFQECYSLCFCQGERKKFDRFVDPNVRGAQRRGYSVRQMYFNWFISST